MIDTLLSAYLSHNIHPSTDPTLSPVPQSYPSYLWAAVWCGGAPVEVVLGQEEGRVGHVQDGVVHQHDLAEVKLVGEPLPFGFVQNALVVVIPAKGGGRGIIEGGME